MDVNVQVPMPPWGTCSRRWGTGRATEWTGIVVDGRFLQAYLALAESGLHDGAVVRPGAGCPPALVDPVRGPVLAVVGGWTPAGASGSARGAH